MTGVVFNLVLNILIIALLVVTIGYCWLLNRRIKILQDSKSELAQLLGHFDESTQRASESIIALQTASKKIGENIQFRIDKANYVLDDLSMMIERGGKVADQLEASFAVQRARNKVLAEKPRSPDEAPEPVKAESLRQAPLAERGQRDMEKLSAAALRDKSSATLEAVLERVVGRQKPVIEAEIQPPPERPVRERTPSRVRSKAEQELLDMIKAGIKG